jgi:hypothetical protein
VANSLLFHADANTNADSLVHAASSIKHVIPHVEPLLRLLQLGANALRQTPHPPTTEQLQARLYPSAKTRHRKTTDRDVTVGDHICRLRDDATCPPEDCPVHQKALTAETLQTL